MINKNIWTTGDSIPSFTTDISQDGGNSLTPTIVSDYIQLSFSMVANAGAYIYVDSSSITDYVIQTGDYIEYDIYWETTDAQIAMDLKTSDSGVLRDASAEDQNGFDSHPNNLLIGSLVNARWYHRRIPITTLDNGNAVGKTLQKYNFSCEYNGGGTVLARIKNIQITDGEVNQPGNYPRNISVGNGMSRSEGAR